MSTEEGPDEKDAPQLLDPEQAEEETNGAARQKQLTNAKDLQATRDEVVAEALSRGQGASEEEGDDEESDEIDSARAELRASVAEEGEEDEGESDLDEEEDGQNKENLPYYQRVLMRARGKDGARMGNLKLHLPGDIVVSLTDKKEGLHFFWKKEILEVEPWSGKPPTDSACRIELTERNLEEILRGRLNPQVAMLSHKVDVQGELSHAIYFFNLFESNRHS